MARFGNPENIVSGRLVNPVSEIELCLHQQNVVEEGVENIRAVAEMNALYETTVVC